MKRCCSCFGIYSEDYDVCPHCGAIDDGIPDEPIHLKPGTLLAGRYYLGKAIGSGGFGIIYKAWDVKLDTVVAVKEFFVSRIMTRAAGQTEVIINRKSIQEFEYRRKRFLAEARTMAKFGAHRNIPNVFEFFTENGTAYIVMELLEGQPLNEFLQENGGKIDSDFAQMIIHEVGNALSSLHKKGIIHRDVAPDNIFICTGSDIRIKLLDLGAAKLTDSTDDVIDIILKPGYSPAEQYDKTDNIGPWTDIYALGATLYVMLTGSKPEESTNRKIEDNVPYPSELDPSIPENISNAVMKAMAVEQHMRFKTVAEMLKYIGGTKKVVSVKKEKGHRIRKRIIGIALACITLAVVGVVVYQYYKTKRSVQYLEDADISIWFCAEKGSDEEDAVYAVVEDFNSTFPNLNIDVRCFPEDIYYDELQNAATDGRLPNLFESTGVGNKILRETVDVSKVLESDQAADCLFLDQYDSYYNDKNIIPLGIEVPVAYVITSGYTSFDYQGDTFENIEELGKEDSIAFDNTYEKLLNQNYGISNEIPKESFMNNEKNTCAVMISSSMELNNIRNTLTNYEKKYVFQSNAKARFIYEWSIGNGSEAQVEASERMLSWMLGNKYQSILMISRCSDGQIPVNEECFKEKIEMQYYLPLKKVYKKIKFDR